MISTIIVIILLYCLITGKYKNYITLNRNIPGINSPISSVLPAKFEETY